MAKTKQKTDELVRQLKIRKSIKDFRVDFNRLAHLPQPVLRYFRLVLKDGQNAISSASFTQAGKLRTSGQSKKWMPFNAIQVVSPEAPGFFWNAKAAIGLFHIRILDSYINGIAAGRASFLSTFTLGADQDNDWLNSGALHRYLAEAVWYPTALLPESGVEWSAIDDRRSLATLRDGNITVSLEFRFNDMGEVVAIYSPGRWGSFDGEYKQVAWEGHFSNYTEIQGVHVPMQGDVGWYDTGKWEVVWFGKIVEAKYIFQNNR